MGSWINRRQTRELFDINICSKHSVKIVVYARETVGRSEIKRSKSSLGGMIEKNRTSGGAERWVVFRIWGIG